MYLSLFVSSACCLGLVVASSVPLFLPEDAEALFERFIQEHHRHYSSEHEKHDRFQIFKDNLERANRMNEKSNFAVFGVTQFMDLTSDEFMKKYAAGLRKSESEATDSDCKHLSDNDIPYIDTPNSFDWRDKKVVTPVKDQMSCHGYSFSATGNIESQYAIKYKELLSFSEQQIIDCDEQNGGCVTGSVTDAFRYIIDNGGLETETDYPFTNNQSHCTFDKSKVKVKLSGCTKYGLKSQYKLKQLLFSTGPISTGINCKNCQIYSGGIISDQDCGEGIPNHTVLLVGYGQTGDKIPYWIVKNSWGEKFGEHGYMLIQRGEDRTSCSILNDYVVSAEVA